ncbi:MAG: hypothetical protein RIQ56_66 [Candidatus Parcubacteria bacterium]|jgi:ribosomal protein L29
MADIKNRSIEDLNKELNEKRENLRAFRFGGAGSRSRNVKEGRNLRKEIARILTELQKRTLAGTKKNA